MDVGVIFGGRSVEHEVSIVTAHQAMAVLGARHEVVPIYVTKGGQWLTGPGLNDLEVYKGKRWNEAGETASLPPGTGRNGLTVAGKRLRASRMVPLDVVVCAIHGTFGEDGTLQGLLEMADVPYTGSGVTASAVGMDKRLMKAAFGAAGLSTVPHVEITEKELQGASIDGVCERVERGVGYPVFVKPAHAGSSVGIARATDRYSLKDAIEIARRYDSMLLAEKAMEGCIEINCSVLGGADREPRVSVCEQPIAWEEFLSYDDKYLRGGRKARSGRDGKSGGMASLDRKLPAPISEEQTAVIQRNAKAAYEAVGASGVARVDAFLNEATGETWLMEINTMPGSFSFYLWEASGLPFEALMEELLAIALAEHEARSQLLFSFDSGMLEQQGWGKSGG